MKVYRDLDEVAAADPGRAIALGTFDGVHLGHRRVIGAAIDRAARSRLRSCVVTFDPHPERVLRPDRPLKLLSTLAIKAERIGELGADELVAIPFTTELSRMSAEEFCAGVLAKRLGATYVSVGANFRFGRGAEGDASTLVAQSQFETETVALVEWHGAPISSTRIRELVQRGDVRDAAELLGAPFALEGEVVSGDKRGRELGVPTANIAAAQDLVMPAAGVYAGIVRARGRDVPSAINIGVRPTFGSGGELVVEAHLIDFDADLYGETLRVSFLERLREELKFDSADELVAQMRRDVGASREIARSATGAARASSGR
ncbi:MAG: bifunctional riboflavin kinase/FAD synthetase [Solirubrobacterales bacterium]